MGKIKTRFIGDTDLEEKQKKEQKARAYEKKLEKKASVEKAPEDKSEVKSETAPKKIKSNKKAESKKLGSRPHSNNYQKAKKIVDKNKIYTLEEAIKLLKEIKYAKFDESIELHFNVDETGLKGEIELPHSTGKTVRVAIVDDKILANLEKGLIDFDILITHPSFMPKLAKFAKVLGPKGLMPNPKAGTISPKPEEVAKKFQKGTLRWKTEAKFPLIHQMIGKISFEDKALMENAKAFILAVGASHITQAVIKSTMSPGIKIELDK